jgi:hypothetical protein
LLVDNSLRKKFIVKLVFQRIFSCDIQVFRFAVLSIRTAITVHTIKESTVIGPRQQQVFIKGSLSALIG